MRIRKRGPNAVSCENERRQILRKQLKFVKERVGGAGGTKTNHGRNVDPTHPPFGGIELAMATVGIEFNQ